MGKKRHLYLEKIQLKFGNIVKKERNNHRNSFQKRISEINDRKKVVEV